MAKIILPQKTAGETISVVFDFSSYLPSGATVSSASCTSIVYSGTDASPASVISGSATISSPTATQKLTGGIAGNVYLITCTATLSNSAIYVLSGFLAVINSYL